MPDRVMVLSRFPTNLSRNSVLPTSYSSFAVENSNSHYNRSKILLLIFSSGHSLDVLATRFS
jgi:hypothetical protein